METRTRSQKILQLALSEFTDRHKYVTKNTEDVALQMENADSDPFLSSGSEYLPSDSDASEVQDMNGIQQRKHYHEGVLFNERCLLGVRSSEACSSNKVSSEKGSDNENNDIHILENGCHEKVYVDHEGDEQCLSGIKQSKKKMCKKAFCIYCKKLLSKFVRHLETVHRNQVDVKKFSVLPKGCSERLKIIETIRRHGNFEFNTNPSYNKGFLITCRRSKADKVEDLSKYEYCSHCKGLFAKRTLFRHHRKCAPGSKKGGRDVLVLGRKIHSNVHAKACNILKENIIPVMREDEVLKTISYDELIILYANTLCKKYRSQHNYNMIRARMRLLGRFLIEIKKKDQRIVDFASMFEPQYYDSMILAVNAVAQLNATTSNYRAPTTAFHLGTLLKQTGNVLISECIKNGNTIKKKDTEDFLKLLEVDFGISVNKSVFENQLEIKRNKSIHLPSTQDIRKLSAFLDKNRQNYYYQLERSFSFLAWKSLAQFTLTSVQVFNRRRAGEIERIKITDFNNHQSVNETSDQDIYNTLSEEMKEKAKSYVRFTIRGKLGREVPVLLHKELLSSMKLLIKFRQQAGISAENPYLFALPDTRKGLHNHLKACGLIRRFAFSCGATHPELLRGTQLRKHIATQSVLLNLQETEVSDLANFMGHAEKVHREHYRMPIVTREITRMSLLLERAQGNDQDDEDEYHRVNSIDGENTFSPETYSPKTSDAANVYSQHAVNLDNHLEQIDCQERNTSIYSPESHPNTDSLQETNSGRYTLETRKRRISSPLGSVKRVSWSEIEVECAMKYLKKNIEDEILPSMAYCTEIIATNLKLEKRTPVQLYAWVNNHIASKKTESQPQAKKTRVLTTWTTPEKQMLRKHFQKNLQMKLLPSLVECKQVLEDNKHVLCKRTPVTIKAWINNQIRKLKLIA